MLASTDFSYLNEIYDIPHTIIYGEEGIGKFSLAQVWLINNYGSHGKGNSFGIGTIHNAFGVIGISTGIIRYKCKNCKIYR